LRSLQSLAARYAEVHRSFWERPEKILVSKYRPDDPKRDPQQ